MGFYLGKNSRDELDGVHPKLVAVVQRAIEITTVDFGVHDGIRHIKTQRDYVARGVSRTMNSKHLRQSDGYGHAVDLVPYINGKLRWEWPPIYHIASAVSQAAQEHDVALRWGGVWDREMSDLPSDADGIREAVAAYCVRHPGPDFIDGPHYELK
jgi:peptidoglycan LD-endopeptidase CwlK